MISDYERGVEQTSALYREIIHEYAAENEELRKRVEESDSYAVAQSLECKLLNALDENQELQEQKKRLVALLLTDYNLDATWDGLRQVWHIELTGDGYVLRDKACEVEAENAKLKDVAKRMLRSLECGDQNSGLMYWPSFSYRQELRKLGVEVDE